MIFLIVFTCCVFELTYVSFAPLRSGGWVSSWHNWLSDNVGLRKVLGGASLLVSIALPCALLAYIFSSIFGDSVLLTFLGGTAVLLYCSGPGDMAQEIESYSRVYQDEDGNQPPPDMDNFLNNVEAKVGDPDGPYMRAIATEASDRLFAPMFWFSVLGPVGALLFRMSITLKQTHSSHTAEAAIAERLYNILIWVPSRLFSVGLGLGGTLGPVMGILSERSVKLTQSDTLLGDAAIAALDQKLQDTLDDDRHIASINNMFSLVKRGFVMWLAVLALLAVAGLV